MGVNHAVSGAAAWVAVTSTAPGFPALGVVQLEPWQILTGAVVCAGAALLPDADHHNATIAHSVPVVGRVAAGAVGTLTGGHRHGLHSILAVVGCWILTGWMDTWTVASFDWFIPVTIGAQIIAIAALLTFALKVLKVAKSWLKAWISGILISAALLVFLPNDLGWFQLCVTLGFTVHIIGDFLTIEGINWFWPLKIRAPKAVTAIPVVNFIWKENGYFALPLLGKTGSIAEYLFATLITLYAGAGLAVNMLGLAL